MAPAAAALMDELVEEILLRIPPDDPARLLHAALVCKRWGRIVSDPGFRRRFREFHRTPPLLGFFRNLGSFVSTSSFRRPPAGRLNFHCLIDVRHGRVLLCNLRRQYDDDGEIHLGSELMVWDPITGQSSQLLLPVTSEPPVSSNAAVLCAYTGGTCDHLDCGRGHFLVVYVCSSKNGSLFAYVYSSEAAAWSQISVQLLRVNHMYFMPLPSALIGNALYFLCKTTVLKYDLAAQEMFLIPLPWECNHGRIILTTTEGGRLGLATISIDIDGAGVYLYLWSREVGPADEHAGWTQTKVIKLRKLLPDLLPCSLRLAGFAHGLDAILLGSSEGTFTIDLKSVQATKVHKKDYWDLWFPYMSFYTPALGAASSEGSRTGTSSA